MSFVSVASILSSKSFWIIVIELSTLFTYIFFEIISFINFIIPFPWASEMIDVPELFNFIFFFCFAIHSFVCSSILLISKFDNTPNDEQ